MKVNYQTLGANLAQCRKAAGLSQKDVAEKLHTYQAQIHKIESGKVVMKLETFFQYVYAIGMRNPEELFEGIFEDDFGNLIKF